MAGRVLRDSRGRFNGSTKGWGKGRRILSSNRVPRYSSVVAHKAGPTIIPPTNLHTYYAALYQRHPSNWKPIRYAEIDNPGLAPSGPSVMNYRERARLSPGRKIAT